MNTKLLPQPPGYPRHMHSIVQDGDRICHIWVYSENALRRIETQYGNVSALMRIKAVSRATAYRIMARQKKRYWLINMVDEGNPVCCSVLPMAVIDAIEPQRRGNPNLRNGYYQREIALRRRKRA